MPLRHEPSSLQRACIVVLGDNWDLICYSCSSPTQMHQLLESDEYLKTEGPFVDIPSSLLEDMLEVIGERRSLSRKYLHLLITEHLQRLNLSFGTGETHYGFQFVQKRCKKLRELNLSYLRDIEPQFFLSIIPYLSSLVQLNLQMTCTYDQVVSVIGDHCPNLRQLNLTSTLVTDDGIFKLSGEKQGDGKKRCQLLQRLIVTDTRVTWLGALSALLNFPQLADLDFDKIYQVFEHLDPSSYLQRQREGLKLRTLYSVAACIVADSIDVAAMLCPNAEVLSIINAWIGNETLYKFMQFEHLRSVTIVNNDGMTLDFDEGVLPFLQVCGPQLDNIILNKFPTVDLIRLGETCPRLKKVALCNIGSYEPKGMTAPVEGIFSSLSTLELWFDDRTEFASKFPLMQLLVSARNITNLLVKKCHALNLETIEKIWAMNPMKKLSRLTTDGCQSMSPSVVYHLLNMSNELTVLRIWSCALITRDESQDFQLHINQNNLNVYLEWFA